MKKLFQLRDLRVNKPVPALFFSDKRKAKDTRDSMNEEAGAAVFVVSPGPDHRRFK